MEYSFSSSQINLLADIANILSLPVAVLALVVTLISEILRRRDRNNTPEHKKPNPTFRRASISSLVIAIFSFLCFLARVSRPSPQGWVFPAMKLLLLGLLIMLFLSIFILWARRFRYQSIDSERASVIPWLIVTILLMTIITGGTYGEQFSIWIDKQYRHIDTIALISDSDDTTIQTIMSRLCNDGELARSAKVQFLCEYRSPGMTQQLESFVENRELTGGVWLKRISMPTLSAEISQTHVISGLMSVRFPDVGELSLPDSESDLELAVRLHILEYVSLLQCDQKDYRTVLKLGDQWPMKRAGDYWPPKNYPFFLRCYIEAAYDSYEGLVLDPNITDLISAIADETTKVESPEEDQALFALAYVRLLLRNGEYGSAEDQLNQINDDLLPLIDETDAKRPFIQATTDRLLGETHLAQFQFEPGASFDKLDSATKYFLETLKITDSASAHYGLGRAYFVRNYSENEDDPSKRTAESANKSLLQNAINELELAANSGSAACLEHNARLWLGAAYVLAGRTEQSDRMANRVSNTDRCDFGMNIQTPIVVTDKTIPVAVGLPRFSKEYMVMTRDYGDEVLSSPLIPDNDGSPIHRAKLDLRGDPWPRPRFVYYASERSPHLALQKVLQLRIQRTDGKGALDIFPVVLSSEVQLNTDVFSPLGGTIQLGDTITVTAFISATLPGAPYSERLTDRAILDMLEICLVTNDEPCKPTQIMQGPNVEGVYLATYHVDHASDHTLVVSVNDKVTHRELRELRSRTVSFNVTTPPPPTSTPDRRPFVVGITNARSLKHEPGDHSRDKRPLRQLCTLIIIEQSGDGDDPWYKVRHFENGYPTGGWIPESSIQMQREFTGEQLPFLGLTTKDRTAVFQDEKTEDALYEEDNCTLVKITNLDKFTSDVPPTRYEVLIYPDNTNPSPGWVNVSDVHRATLGTR